jgi:hypothetical protein
VCSSYENIKSINKQRELIGVREHDIHDYSLSNANGKLERRDIANLVIVDLQRRQRDFTSVTVLARKLEYLVSRSIVHASVRYRAFLKWALTDICHICSRMVD